MFSSEAARLREILLAAGEISPLLNLGSSTGEFRTVEKPHIDAELFAPLRKAGIEIVHCDLKPAPGVDIAGDILDPQLQASLSARGLRCVLMSNLLEHVIERESVAGASEAIVGTGGLILATVPASYPYHADPIDTGYRPTSRELAALFGNSTVLLAEEIEGESYREQMREQGVSPAMELIRTLLWAIAAPVRPKTARARLSRWFWYRNPYRVSVALLRVG